MTSVAPFVASFCVGWTARLWSPLVLARVISIVIRSLSYTKVVPVAHGQRVCPARVLKHRALSHSHALPVLTERARQRDRAFLLPLCHTGCNPGQWPATFACEAG